MKLLFSGRAGPGLAMQRAETGRALNSIRARGPGRGREVYGPGRAGPGRAEPGRQNPGPCRPLLSMT